MYARSFTEFYNLHKKSLNHQELSKNYLLPFSVVETNLGEDWNWGFLSFNRTLTVELIKKFKTKPWNPVAVSSNPAISLKDINDNYELIPWNHEAVSSRPECFELDFNYDLYPKLEFFKNTYCNIIRINMKSLPGAIPAKLNKLSRNPKMVFSLVAENPNLSWDWDALSSNLSISLADILIHRDLSWNWTRVAGRKDMTPDLVDFLDRFRGIKLDRVAVSASCSPSQYPDWNWDYQALSRNKNLRIDFVLSHRSQPWNWGLVSSNRGISLQDILANPTLPWDWNAVCTNSRIHVQEVLDNPTLPWNLSILASNCMRGEAKDGSVFPKKPEAPAKPAPSESIFDFVTDSLGLEKKLWDQSRKETPAVPAPPQAPVVPAPVVAPAPSAPPVTPPVPTPPVAPANSDALAQLDVLFSEIPLPDRLRILTKVQEHLVKASSGPLYPTVPGDDFVMVNKNE